MGYITVGGFCGKSFSFGRTSVLKDSELSMCCSCQQLGRGRIMFYALLALCSSSSTSVMLVTAENQSIVFVSHVDDVLLMRGWHLMFKMVLQHNVCKLWMHRYAYISNPCPYVKQYNEEWLKGMAANSTPPQWTKTPICCSHGYLWLGLVEIGDRHVNSFPRNFLFFMIWTRPKGG